MNWASRLDWQIKMAVAGARRHPSVCVEVQQTDVNTDPSSSSSKSGEAWGRGGGSACQSRVWSGANPLPANSALMIYAVQLWQEGRPTAVAHGLIIRFQQQAANKPTNKQHNTVGPPAVGVTEQTRNASQSVCIFVARLNSHLPQPSLLLGCSFFGSISIREYFCARFSDLCAKFLRKDFKLEVYSKYSWLHFSRISLQLMINKESFLQCTLSGTVCHKFVLEKKMLPFFHSYVIHRAQWHKGQTMNKIFH